MRLRLLPAVLILGGLLSPAQADTVRRANLIDLSQGAAVIISGRVVGVQDETDGANTPVRVVSIRVDDVLKAADRGRRGDPQAGRVYQFKQWNDPSLRWTHLQMPEYAPGEDVLVFLAGTSSRGLTSPLALDQGKFTVRTTRKGARVNRSLQNARNNANLPVLDPEQPQPAVAHAARTRSELARVAGVTLSAAEHHLLTRNYSGPVEYASFVRLVKKLARTGRKN